AGGTLRGEAVRPTGTAYSGVCRMLPRGRGNDVLTSIGLFHTQEGAEAAISLQRDWFRDEWSSFRPLPPEVVAGAVLAQATVDGTVPAERRLVIDRRHAAALPPAGPWNGLGRRA